MKKMRRRRKQTPFFKWRWEFPLAIATTVHLLLIALFTIGVHTHTSLRPGFLDVQEVFVGEVATEPGATTATPTDTPKTTPQTKVHTRTIATVARQASTNQPKSTEGSAETNSGNSGNSGNNEGLGTGKMGNGNSVIAEIKRRIERAKRYPQQAITMQLEGQPVVEFSIRPSGDIATLQLSKSSGHPELDNAALDAVRRSTPLPYVERHLSFPILFRIR